MATITLTQTQFDAIPVVAKQIATAGLKVKKFDGKVWIQIEYINEGANGNWNLIFSEIVLDNRDRSVQLAKVALDKIQDALRDEVTSGSLTLANATTLFAYVSNPLLALNLGWVRESRMLCNNLATTAQFTTGRKNFMLARIDEVIALL